MMPGVKISASTKQKDEITLEGNDIELVSRSGKFRLHFFKKVLVQKLGNLDGKEVGLFKS